MKTLEEIFDLLKNKFGEAIIELVSDKPAESFITADPLEIDKICYYLKDEKGLEFNSLMNLSGVDDANGEKVRDENEILKGGTLSVFYHLESTI
jgi:NADH-quinone oxidoreductase subunit C